MAARGRGSGRRGALDEARELVALVASLSEAGDALAPEAVASRLGVSRERAEALIELVLTAAGAEGARLPLVEDAEGVTLAFSQGMRGRRVRLTRAETLALAAALEALGVPGDDPLRQRLEGCASEDPVSENLVERLLGGGPGERPAAVEACAEALARRSDLAFAYRKAPAGPGSAAEKDGAPTATPAPEPRLVSPLRLYLEDGAWYLSAFDLVRQAERTFRLDRMESPELRPRAQRPERSRRPRQERLVRLAFADERYLDLLPWHDLRPAGRDERTGAALFDTPLYEGTWLARMVAACGGACTTTDPALAEQVRSYAATQLASTPGD